MVRDTAWTVANLVDREALDDSQAAARAVDVGHRDQLTSTDTQATSRVPNRSTSGGCC
jgi:hypothetical protein